MPSSEGSLGSRPRSRGARSRACTLAGSGGRIVVDGFREHYRKWGVRGRLFFGRKWTQKKPLAPRIGCSRRGVFATTFPELYRGLACKLSYSSFASLSSTTNSVPEEFSSNSPCRLTTQTLGANWAGADFRDLLTSCQQRDHPPRTPRVCEPPEQPSIAAASALLALMLRPSRRCPPSVPRGTAPWEPIPALRKGGRSAAVDASVYRPRLAVVVHQDREGAWVESGDFLGVKCRMVGTKESRRSRACPMFASLNSFPSLRGRSGSRDTLSTPFPNRTAHRYAGRQHHSKVLRRDRATRSLNERRTPLRV